MSDALHKWLLTHVADLGDGPFATELISGGHSNVTIGVRIGDRELVVRRPPETAFLPTANDVSREYAPAEPTRIPLADWALDLWNRHS